MRPETSGFLGSNPLIHSYSLFLHLPLYPCSPPPPLFHFVPFSPDNMPGTCDRKATEKFADHWAVPSPLPPFPSLPCKGGQAWCWGGTPRHGTGSSDSKSRPRAQLPRPATPSQGPPPLGPGEHHTPGVMDSPGTFKGLCICLQCRP